MARVPDAGAAGGLHLPRARRIQKRPEFLRIQASAVRVTTRHLLMLLALRTNDGLDGGVRGSADGPARLGVVASKKVGPAVARNRCKRLVREAFRKHPEVFPARLDIVIVVRPGTQDASQQEIDEQVRKARPFLLRRAAELIAEAGVPAATARSEGASPAAEADRSSPKGPPRGQLRRR